MMGARREEAFGVSYRTAVAGRGQVSRFATPRQQDSAGVGRRRAACCFFQPLVDGQMDDQPVDELIH